MSSCVACEEAAGTRVANKCFEHALCERCADMHIDLRIRCLRCKAEPLHDTYEAVSDKSPPERRRLHEGRAAALGAYATLFVQRQHDSTSDECKAFLQQRSNDLERRWPRWQWPPQVMETVAAGAVRATFPDGMAMTTYPMTSWLFHKLKLGCFADLAATPRDEAKVRYIAQLRRLRDHFGDWPSAVREPISEGARHFPRISTETAGFDWMTLHATLLEAYVAGVSVGEINETLRVVAERDDLPAASAASVDLAARRMITVETYSLVVAPSGGHEYPEMAEHLIHAMGLGNVRLDVDLYDLRKPSLCDGCEEKRELVCSCPCGLLWHCRACRGRPYWRVSEARGVHAGDDDDASGECARIMEPEELVEIRKRDAARLQERLARGAPPGGSKAAARRKKRKQKRRNK